MTNWTDFLVVGENIVEYLFGSYTMFAIVISIVYLIGLLAVGLEFKYAFPLLLPVVALFFFEGWFMNNPWIYSLILLCIGLIYAYAVIKLTSR